MAEERVTESHDWVTQLTNRLSRLVDILQDFSLKPALGVARSLLIGTVGLIIGFAVLIALVVGITKLFNHDVFGGRVWATDFLFGGMTMVAGAFLFRSGVRKKGQRDA
jgi:ABC-type arginine/histidine transport system permease subunit